MMKLTFEQYDKMIEDFESIESPAAWVDIEKVDEINEDPDKWIPYLCYLLEKCKEPQTTEEENCKKNIKKFINSHLELFDSEE